MRNAPQWIVAAAASALMLLSQTMEASTADRLLSIVPADAVSVAMVRVDDMRRSPNAQSIFATMTAGGIDGDAERMLREAGLQPAEDVDTVVVALSPSTSTNRSRMLVAAGGRFDPVRLATVIETRGAIRKSSGGTTYFLAPDAEARPGTQPAVSVYDRNLVLAGTEEAVVAAIGALQRGEDRFSSSTLGRQMFRIHPRASGWMLFDVERAQQTLHKLKAPGASPFGDSSFAAIRNVSTISLWVAETNERLEFGSAAVAADRETRALVEDVLRGLLATLRMAAQEKQPRMVKVVRGFTITSDAGAVSLSGSVPAAMVTDFVARLK